METGLMLSGAFSLSGLGKTGQQKINPVECARISLFVSTLERETAMRKARNILAFILRFFAAEPIFSARGRFVI
jgi:hypothetical protein